MNAERGKVVTVQYTLTDAEGKVLDTSVGDEPLLYLHGYDEIPAGLERVVEGAGKGFKSKVTLEPDQAFGERDDELIIEVPRSELPEDIDTGEEIWGDDDEGEPQAFTVMQITDEAVRLDGNNPYAGKTLTFEVEVMDVRDATAEEIEHGHAHEGDEEDC